MFSNQKEKDLYVQGVWEKVEATYLGVYPFLTDEEFQYLFGEKILKAMAMLSCPQEDCGACDIDIDCPFYSRKLDRCGIHPYKPVHCRLWHCYDCGPEPLVKQIRELTGIFADHMGPEGGARKIKSALERGDLSANEAGKRFLKLVEQFRNGKGPSTGI